MTFLEYLETRQEHLLELTIEHIVIVVEAIVIATVIGLVLGILTYQTRRPREIVLAITGTFLTIPSLALFGLFIVWIGLGTAPVLIALVMYALLPIVRNTIVGLREVDPSVVESAQGMGMNRVQRLLRIELPLAWPVVIAGMRVSTLVVLGIAAIGAYINGPGLGNDIFTGLARIGTSTAVYVVLGGMLGILILAVLFDLLYVLIFRLTTSRGLR
ncbi:ABC transporter permease [Haloactinopolyspora sp.]|jgi:osmoprotectant transport system permease protein|uniref:ABC transporter permease n=1 Tax=Haloactinopolyspora sp. TaxID=1966353 RepID=UPI00261E7934|nr:ABC transporter permease [Haloactinopolyspora sp.]